MAQLSKRKTKSLPVLEPNLQASFYLRLQTVRALFLGDALRVAVERIDLAQLDAQLRAIVDEAPLRKVALSGVRGEAVFAVPAILRANPFLLGYYRLFLGFSQKEFYQKGPFGRFRRLEDAGEIPHTVDPELEKLCGSLTASAAKLVENVEPLTVNAIQDLQLLTLGPQLRGAENTQIGQRATKRVREVIDRIVASYIQEETKTSIIVKNDSGRLVHIEFLSDPDVRVTERLASGMRPTLAMEIKGGRDFSNIHNRLGEAEKSHLKARNLGFREFWTIIGVDLEHARARQGSPTTNQFFSLPRLLATNSPESRRFRELFASFIGIR